MDSGPAHHGDAAAKWRDRYVTEPIPANVISVPEMVAAVDSRDDKEKDNPKGGESTCGCGVDIAPLSLIHLHLTA